MRAVITSSECCNKSKCSVSNSSFSSCNACCPRCRSISDDVSRCLRWATSFRNKSNSLTLADTKEGPDRAMAANFLFSTSTSSIACKENPDPWTCTAIRPDAFVDGMSPMLEMGTRAYSCTLSCRMPSFAAHCRCILSTDLVPEDCMIWKAGDRSSTSTTGKGVGVDKERAERGGGGWEDGSVMDDVGGCRPRRLKSREGRGGSDGGCFCCCCCAIGGGGKESFFIAGVGAAGVFEGPAPDRFNGGILRPSLGTVGGWFGALL